MTLVTVAEARENLPELLRRAAAGERIVITEDGKWLAALDQAPPPDARPSEDETNRQMRVRGAIREMVRQMVEAGNPPPAESKIWEVVAEGRE